jgi:hypothetical protein
MKELPRPDDAADAGHSHLPPAFLSYATVYQSIDGHRLSNMGTHMIFKLCSKLIVTEMQSISFIIQNASFIDNSLLEVMK